MRLIRLIASFLFLLGAVLGAAEPAYSTILFAGGEDIDLTFVGTITTNTSNTTYQTNFARLSLAPSGGATDPPSNRMLTPVFANQSTIWIHSMTVDTSNNNTSSGDQAVAVYGSDGVRRLMIRGTGTGGQVKISKRDASGTFTDLVSCTIGAWPVLTTKITLDWFVNYAVAGETTLYAGGVQICDFVGDVTTNSVTAVNQVDWSNPVPANNVNWSEEIISTTDTRSMNLFTCFPSANGTNMQWTGSFSNINPTQINDASVISAGSSSLTAEFTCPTLPTGSFSVPAVTQTVRALKGASGPGSFYYIARPATGSTDYNNGTPQAATTNFANYHNVWAQNPACSCGWVTGDLGVGVNFGVQSQP